MKKLIQASAFVLFLSICAHADDGIIQGGKPVAPPSASEQQPSEEPTETSEGIMQSGIIQTDVADAVTDASLHLVQDLLNLF